MLIPQLLPLKTHLLDDPPGGLGGVECLRDYLRIRGNTTALTTSRSLGVPCLQAKLGTNALKDYGAKVDSWGGSHYRLTKLMEFAEVTLGLLGKMLSVTADDIWAPGDSDDSISKRQPKSPVLDLLEVVQLPSRSFWPKTMRWQWVEHFGGPAPGPRRHVFEAACYRNGLTPVERILWGPCWQGKCYNMRAVGRQNYPANVPAGAPANLEHFNKIDLTAAARELFKKSGPDKLLPPDC